MVLAACAERKSKKEAEAYMHASRFEELVERFENDKREEWQRPDMVLNFMNLNEKDVVADIGAGTGYFSVLLAKKVDKVYALDIDHRFVNYLKKRVDSLGLSNIEVIQSEPDRPGLPPLTCHKMLIVNTAHHFDKAAKYLTRCKKALRFGGELFIVDFKTGDFEVGPPDEYKLSAREMLKTLAMAGFHNIEIDSTTLKYQYMIKAQ